MIRGTRDFCNRVNRFTGRYRNGAGVFFQDGHGCHGADGVVDSSSCGAVGNGYRLRSAIGSRCQGEDRRGGARLEDVSDRGDCAVRVAGSCCNRAEGLSGRYRNGPGEFRQDGHGRNAADRVVDRGSRGCVGNADRQGRAIRSSRDREQGRGSAGLEGVCDGRDPAVGVARSDSDRLNRLCRRHGNDPGV